MPGLPNHLIASGPSITLDLTKVKQQTRLGGSVLSSMRLHTYPDYAASREVESLVLALEAYVLTDHLSSKAVEVEFTVKVPDGWFQMLKATRMRDWILRRWPVRYTTITQRKVVHHQADLLYPEATMALPPKEFGQPYRWERWEFE